MLARVIMGENDGTLGAQPLVAVGMIEVPMGIDQMSDRIGAEARQRRSDPRARNADPGIDQDPAVEPREHGDIPARALEHADIATQRMDIDRCRGGRGTDAVDDALRPGEDLAWRQPARRCREGRGAQAA
jgi:hypothetical protein